jgi:hypothetical protein
MENKEFKNIINELLKPLGFKNKGNYWRLETDEIEKVINLQKSNYSNLYYFNYGYNLNNLDYDKVTMHVFGRLSQSEVFDLENDLDSTIRIKKIIEIINIELLPKLKRINSESDILDLLKGRPHLNDIPIKVKEYLKLKD